MSQWTYLEKRGWRLHSSKHMGCVIKRWWIDPQADPVNGKIECNPQGQAVEIQRRRDRRNKAAALEAKGTE